MGGTGASGPGLDVMQLFALKTAKDLAVDYQSLGASKRD